LPPPLSLPFPGSSACLVFLAVTVPDGAVVAHPKIAEVRVREGEIPSLRAEDRQMART